jgi:hypothetical protein
MQIGIIFATYSATDGGQNNAQFREPSAISNAAVSSGFGFDLDCIASYKYKQTL